MVRDNGADNRLQNSVRSMARCLVNLILWVMRDVHTQATIKTMKIKNGSNSIVYAVKVCISVIIVDYSEDIRL